MSEIVTLGSELEGFVRDIFEYRERLTDLKTHPKNPPVDSDENLNDRLTLTEDLAAQMVGRVERARFLIDELLKKRVVSKALKFVRMDTKIQPFLDQLIKYIERLPDFRSPENFDKRYEEMEQLLSSLVDLFSSVNGWKLAIMKRFSIKRLLSKMINNIAYFVEDMREYRDDHESLKRGDFSYAQRQTLIEKLALELAKKADTCKTELERLYQVLG